MKKYFLLSLLFCFLFSFSNSKAQSYDQFCGESSGNGLNKTSNLSAALTSYIPTTGTFRTLVVLCKFSDDTFDLSPHTDLWPHTLNSMPSWGPNLVSTTVQSSYSNPSVSGYFKTMSSGLYDVIGDVVFYQPQHEQSYYFLSSGRHLGYLTEEILTVIDPIVNYANYDNNGDGKVDMIQICFRFARIHMNWTFVNLMTLLTLINHIIKA